ncbi:MAG: YihA family ribosome biogenesis GTP-binding protein [Hyphomicrobiaceae bacterium]|nr:YihA family ribosome biogenesis GTP-binding protein [Hyphomicrobiaceae bacterium]
MDSLSFTEGDFRAGEALFRRPWQFLLSAPRLEALPPAAGPEIAFSGRSNVGKSSLINALVGRRGLARTSNTPGRTQQLNFFTAPGIALFIVDMPGYGFAQAPKATVDEWTGLVRDYLRGRPTLLRVFLLIDARHGPKPVDVAIMDLMDQAAVSYQAVLTKVDKIKHHELAEMELSTSAAVASHGAAFPTLLATSAQTGAGIPELRAEIARLVPDPGRSSISHERR